ncbi:MAG TPA: phosphatidylglycerol lysyltransferase domain-containing protein [Armatimonadota bacterium]|jgi:hypothetical protein
MLPEFPEFKLLDLDDKEPLEGYLREHPPLISELTFTNLFAWREIYKYGLCRYRDGFLVSKGEGDQLTFLQPLVPDGQQPAIRDCLDYLRGKVAAPAIDRVGEDIIGQYQWDPAEFTLDEERDQFDYVYHVKELIDLPGDKFHDKKNLVNQFTKKFSYEYREMTPEVARRGLDFAHEWCIERRCEESEGLTKENCATIQILRHFAHLTVTGGAIYYEGEMIAFEIGEPLNADTYVIHIEKAHPAIIGLYQAINREFLRHAVTDCPYVNREQDLGVPGLRKAKLSYNPVRLVKKYRVADAGRH